ncbi:MAG: GAF domain-containing sensor histidine kinase [Deltaproteobacteria bacterium]|nr:GAF domain-containing sensor histidine kinase [Deltaproteobacteria bacterium]
MSGAWEPEPRQLLFLHRATAVIFADPSDYGGTVDALCSLVVPEVADWCAVDLICEDGTLARAAVRHRFPALNQAADELRQLPPAAGPIDPERVAAEGHAELAVSVDADPELRAARDRSDRAAELVRQLGISSFVCVPLLARGRRLGALTLAAGPSGRRFRADELPFAEELAARCALALDNARIFREGEEARRLAEEVARAKEDAARFGEQLLGIVSHDLRSPLAAVQASTQLALRRAGPDEALQRALRRASNSAERMGRMIEDLLDFTRARLGGGIPLSRREADLGKIARYAVEEAQAANPEHPLVHRLHYEKGEYDPDRMSQVVQNLIANALQHGAPRAPVVVETRPEPDAMVLEVSNQGQAIPAELLPELFEPFRRGAHGKARNLGLGLFIVREVVRSHGGTVEVSSSAQTTTFTVRLPRRA